MANIPVQKAVFPVGALLTRQAAGAGGDTVKKGAHQALLVKNGDTGAHVVTVVDPGVTPFGQPNPDVTVSVAAGAERLILLPYKGLDVNGVISITYDGVTSVTVAALTI